MTPAHPGAVMIEAGRNGLRADAWNDRAPVPAAAKVHLAAPERAVLEQWVRRATTPPLLAQRAKAILACAAGATDARVAREAGWTVRTVTELRSCFATAGIDGLFDAPRRGGRRTIPDARVEEVVALTRAALPDGAPWSAQAVASRCGVSPETVRRIWRMFGLHPHRTAAFRLSKDSLLAGRIADLAGVYLDGSHRALVLCVDQTAAIQAIGRAQAVAPMRTGQLGRSSHEHVWGVASTLFAALDAKSRAVDGVRCRLQRFRTFLDAVGNVVPDDLDPQVVLFGTPAEAWPLIRQWSARRRRSHVHVAPMTAWRRLGRRWFGALTLRQMHDGASSTGAFEAAIDAYVGTSDDEVRPFCWTATRDQILAGTGRPERVRRDGRATSAAR